MTKEIGKVYETDDYSIFKRIEGNRDVTAQRAQKIMRNIMNNGYVLNPIVVNEKFEIIDGQGRMEALSQLRLPIHYIIAEGAGVKECAVLNSANTTWRLADYINSYAQLGNENYLRARKLFKENSNLPRNAIASILTGLGSHTASQSIKDGNLIITDRMYEEALVDFAVAQEFIDDLKRVNGTLEHYVYAIVFAVKSGVNKSRLKKVVSTVKLPPAPDRRCAFDYLSDAYNKGLTVANKVYLYPMYEESMVSRYGWYGARLAKNGGKGWNQQK